MLRDLILSAVPCDGFMCPQTPKLRRTRLTLRSEQNGPAQVPRVRPTLRAGHQEVGVNLDHSLFIAFSRRHVQLAGSVTYWFRVSCFGTSKPTKHVLSSQGSLKSQVNPLTTSPAPRSRAQPIILPNTTGLLDSLVLAAEEALRQEFLA